MLSKIWGKLSKIPLTMLKIDSAALDSISPRDSVKALSAGEISIPFINAMPRFFALSFILDSEFENVFAIV